MDSIKAALKKTALGLQITQYRRRKFVARALYYGQFDGVDFISPSSTATKQNLVAAYARQFELPILVETGTFLGDMVAACQEAFSRIISVELDPILAERARRRFASLPFVTIIEGDSCDVLNQILPGLSQPCLFWLDGHYSGGITAHGQTNTPVLQEIAAVFRHPIRSHVILIDDARMFTGEEDYPTLAELSTFMGASGYHIQCVQDDIVCIVPS